MSARIQELDWRRTPMGEISLRRRRDPATGEDVYEIRLDDEFLMSSMYTVAEVELARLALRRAPDGPVDVVVGGLGLGFTAQAVLDDARVRSLVVVEALGEVIEWHERGLIPAGAALTADTRCRLVHGDFFALVRGGLGESARSNLGESARGNLGELARGNLRGLAPEGRFHAALVDIDHSPRHLLTAAHSGFYQPAGLRELAGHLHQGGVFGLWSNDPPDEQFTAGLSEVFADVATEQVRFPNPLQDREAANTIYLARRAS